LDNDFLTAKNTKIYAKIAKKTEVGFCLNCDLLD